MKSNRGARDPHGLRRSPRVLRPALCVHVQYLLARRVLCLVDLAFFSIVPFAPRSLSFFPTALPTSPLRPPARAVPLGNSAPLGQPSSPLLDSGCPFTDSLRCCLGRCPFSCSRLLHPRSVVACARFSPSVPMMMTPVAYSPVSAPSASSTVRRWQLQSVQVSEILSDYYGQFRPIPMLTILSSEPQPPAVDDVATPVAAEPSPSNSSSL